MDKVQKHGGSYYNVFAWMELEKNSGRSVMYQKTSIFLY